MYMTASSAATPTAINGMGAAAVGDGSGTINPAALNNAGQSPLHAQPQPRGQKRSRSPDHAGDMPADEIDETQQVKKRNRTSQGTSPNAIAHGAGDEAAPTRSTNPPDLYQHIVPHDVAPSTKQTSPTKAATTKAPVIKALPTVRDHTTDQLTPEHDEYIPREFDQEGETKASLTGHLQDGREYKMRTFIVPHRGQKLFMLATECARVLGYRDSYLLFNKNRSLYKIIATQAEKDELIQQDILPYSYRSRQIAIVTAKSMFRQFGARVILNGRRVRDDYWEAKARKQGFTEEDMAGDKRPGTGKARDAAALEAAHNELAGGMANQDVTYRDIPLPPHLAGPLPMPNANTPIPMIQTGVRDYGNLPRQRQDLSGLPYQDKTQPSSAADIMHQAGNAADMSKNITQQRNYRAKNYQDSWNKKIDVPLPPSQPKIDQSPTMNARPSTGNALGNPSHQQPSLQHHPNSQMMSPQRYHQPHPQNPHAQSPVRQTMPPAMRPEIHHPQRSSVYNPGQPGTPQSGGYSGYPQASPHLWGQPHANPSPHGQPQQSPVSHHASVGQHYTPSPHQAQIQHSSPSPHPQQQHALPQMPQGNPQGNYYGNMGAMQSGANMYGPMGQQRSMYHQPPGGMHGGSPHPPQQGFMHQTTGAQQSGVQGFAPPPMGSSGQSWGGYPASSGF